MGEVYGGIDLQITSPPSTNFFALDTISCNGTISFTDLSSNVPTS